MWQCELAEPDKLQADHFSQIRAIYEESFAPAMREPASHLIEGVREGLAELYLAWVGGRVGGFAVGSPLGIPGVNYLVYLAVAGPQRGVGIGAALFRFLLNEAYRRRGDTELLWEVERPRPEAPPGDEDRRRIAFYERHGGVLLDRVGDFQMPSMAGPGSLPGALMWTTVIDRAPLTTSELEAYVLALFGNRYGRGRDDPLVAAVLASILTEG